MKESKKAFRTPKDEQLLNLDEMSLKNAWEELEKKVDAMETKNSKQPNLRIVKYRPSALEQLKSVVRKVKWKMDFWKIWEERA